LSFGPLELAVFDRHFSSSLRNPLLSWAFGITWSRKLLVHKGPEGSSPSPGTLQPQEYTEKILPSLFGQMPGNRQDAWVIVMADLKLRPWISIEAGPP
jgi:hypothetical protein